MVRREIGRQRGPLRDRARESSRVVGLLILPIILFVAANGCGASTKTSTGPTPAKCQPSAALSTPSVAAAGGPAVLTVTTQQECAWTVASAVPWISGLSPASGQGNAEVTFSVANNPDATARQGDLILNEQPVRVRQDAAACKYDLVPRSWSLDAAGGEWDVKVSANGCVWLATSNTGWIRVKSGQTGTRDGTVIVEADANTGPDARSGSLTIAGESFGVAQGGTSPDAPPPPPPPLPPPPPPPSFTCSYTLSPTTHAAPAAGGTGTTTIQTNHPGCVWNVSSDSAWLTFTTPTGAGSQGVGFTVAANTGAGRTGRLTIGGQVLTVTQAAAPPPPPTCTFSLAPTSQSVGVLGGTATVAVTTTATCSWSATTGDAWIAITGGASGTGNGKVALTIAANLGAARTGTVTIGGQTFTVNQASALPGPGCSYTINPTSRTTGDGGATDQKIDVNTQSGCAWTAVSSAPWVTITQGLVDVGDGEVRYTVAANTGAARQTTLTVAGRTFTVNQDAAPCSYTINPTTQTFAATGGSGTVAVATAAHCAWTAVSNDSWIVVTAGASGTGNGAVTYTVAARTGGSSRKGTITIAGRTFTVQQN
jgi:all-beta uncharacterized protein/BACON domain-containing protein